MPPRGRRPTPIEVDLADDAAVAAAGDRILAETGRIDVVVDNAGTLSFGLLESFTIAQACDVFDVNVNVLGALRVDGAVLPHMRERGGGRLTIAFYGLYRARNARSGRSPRPTGT